MSGYKNTKSKCGDISIKIKDVELAEKVRDYCKRLDLKPSDFVSDAVERFLENAYSEYLKTLSKEELISMLLKKEEQEGKEG